MKKLKFLSLLLPLSILIASCSDDDEPVVNLATDAIGTYQGYAIASCPYFDDMVNTRQSVTITSTKTDRVNIRYQSDTWGSFTVTDAKLAGNKGNIAITGSGKSVMGMSGNTPKEYDCTVEGSLNGSDLNLTFICPTVMGGLKIEFKQGDAPATE